MCNSRRFRIVPRQSLCALVCGLSVAALSVDALGQESGSKEVTGAAVSLSQTSELQPAVVEPDAIGLNSSLSAQPNLLPITPDANGRRQASAGTCEKCDQFDCSQQIGIQNFGLQECNVGLCWDLNGNGVCDPTGVDGSDPEDLSGDGICDYQDCLWQGLAFPFISDGSAIDTLTVQLNTNFAGGDVHIARDFFGICQPDVNNLLATMCCALEGKPIGESFDIHFPAFTPTNGETIWVLFVGRTGFADLDAEGNCDGTLRPSHQVARDLTPSQPGVAFANLAGPGIPTLWSDLNDFADTTNGGFLGTCYCVDLSFTDTAADTFDCSTVPVGACCGLEGDTCIAERCFECGADGGTFLGDGTTCDNCSGGCCGPDADPTGCTQTDTETICTGLGGTFVGSGTECANCPAPACFNATNECLEEVPFLSGIVGCDDFNCCAAICEANPFCCDEEFGEWDFLCAAEAALSESCPPANNDCADAETIGEGTTAFSTSAATTDGLPNPFGLCNDGAEPDDPETPDVDESQSADTHNDAWYQHTANCTGILRVSTCNEDGGDAFYDSDIVVYEGCETCPPDPDTQLVACNDDAVFENCVACTATGTAFASRVNAPVSSGTCYTIRVGGWGEDDDGTGTLSVSCLECGDGVCEDIETSCNCPADCGAPQPGNDCFGSATALVGLSVAFDTTGYTTDGAANALDACNDGGDNQTAHDAWFTRTATCTGTMTVSTCVDNGGSADYDSDIVVYEECFLHDDGTPTACAVAGCNDDDDACSVTTSSTVSIPVLQGVDYIVRLGGKLEGESGTGTLAVKCTPFDPADGSCDPPEYCDISPDDCGACISSKDLVHRNGGYDGENGGRPTVGWTDARTGDDFRLPSCRLPSDDALAAVGGTAFSDVQVAMFNEGADPTALQISIYDIDDVDNDGVPGPGDGTLVGMGLFDLAVPKCVLDYTTAAGTLVVTDTGDTGFSIPIFLYDGIGTTVCDPGEGHFALIVGMPGTGAEDFWNTAPQDNSDCVIIWGPAVQEPGDFGCAASPEFQAMDFTLRGGGGPCNGACAQDVDFSGDVRVPDLIVLLGCWGSLPGGDPRCACLDTDGSNDIRVPDLIVMLGEWGTCP